MVGFSFLAIPVDMVVVVVTGQGFEAARCYLVVVLAVLVAQ